MFTPAHRNVCLGQLEASGFPEVLLRDYYNVSNGVKEPNSGMPMLDGINAFAQSLAALEENSAIVFVVS